MAIATRSKEVWQDGRRANPGRRAGTILQNFLVNIGNFLESFAGIAELLKAADDRYGGLAYGTISLLLSVAVHKQKREEGIEDGLEELSYALPRLRTLEELDPSIELQKQIARVFALTIEFCRDSACYYADRWERFKGTFSPKAQKMKTLSRIREALAETRKEVDVLTLTRITQLQDGIREMQQTLAQQEGFLKRAKRREEGVDASKLRNLFQRLGLEKRRTVLPHTDTPSYKALLVAAFSHDLAKLNVPRTVTWDLLQQQQSFFNWLKNEESCIFLAAGTNWSSSEAGTLNWLSQASVLSVEYLEEHSDVVARFYCQHSHYMARRYDLRYIIANVADQISKQHIEFVSPVLGELKEAIGHLESDETSDEEMSVKQAIDILGIILRELPEETRVSIIVDRLDQCSWLEKDRISPTMLQAVVQALLELVREASCQVKVLLVVEAASAREMTGSDSDLLRQKDDKYLCEPEWIEETEEEWLAKHSPGLSRTHSSPV